MSAAELARRYFEIEMTRDVDAIADLFASDARMLTPSATYHGREHIREFYVDAVARFPRLQVDVTVAVATDSTAAVEWVATFTDRQARTTRLRGANVFWFGADRIAEVHAYFDATAYATAQ